MDEAVPDKLQHYTNIFMLHTPARSKGGFPLLAEDAMSKTAWITALRDTVRCSKHPVQLRSKLEAAATASASPSGLCTREQLSYEDEENISAKVTTVF